MPPKRTFKDSDDDDDRSSEESTTTEEEEDNDTEEEDEDEETVNVNHRSAVDTSGVVGGQLITNNPNDEAFDVEEDDEEKKTPPQGHLNASGSNAASASLGAGGAVGATAAIPGGGNTLMNNPNDEVFEVDDNQRHVPTPQTDGAAHAHGRIGADGHNAADSNAKVIKNDKHDEFSDVEDDDEDVQTPPRTGDGQLQQQQQQQRQQQQQQPGGVNGANLISNDHHDEAIEIDGSSVETSPERSPEKSTFTKQISPANNASATTVTQQQQQQVVGGVARGNMKPADSDEDDDDEEVDTSDDDDGNQSGPMMGQITAAAEAAAGAGATGGDQLYRSEDYAYLRDKVDAEVFELFGYIDQFQVSAIELPSKFRPFVPEFIPCVGDIDAFCKVPRPDGLADGLGLHVIDEPSTYQSNPAVVKMNLEYGSKMTVKNQHVESVAEAASRPVLIDRWVAEIKETHAKKPLPSVNYSKPMPDIEELLQVWPAEFEDLLSSDLQFPPPQIDLDIEQYCRVMCTMLDIPIYDNIIESLHVMFTLFLEFRANQHFQHA